MRITAGFLKNRSLKVPSLGVRPTSDKVRQALFNVLFSQNYSLSECRFLDCCAGSGSVGFEALSRGAQKIGFIEKNKNAFALLKENAASLNIKSSCDFFFCSAEKLFPCLEPYTIAFIDPPYNHKNAYISILLSLDHYGWLSHEGIVIVETSKEIEFMWPLPFTKIIEKNYGLTQLTFLLYKKEKVILKNDL